MTAPALSYDYLKALNPCVPSMARGRKMLEWMRENSPYERHEQLANLWRALASNDKITTNPAPRGFQGQESKK